MYKFKQILIIAFIVVFAFSSSVFAEGSGSAIDILYSNGIVRGDGNSLAPERYITYGEFAAINGRIFNARNGVYDDMEHYVMTHDLKEGETEAEKWKRLVLWTCGGMYTPEQLSVVSDNFYERITTDFAVELILAAFNGNSFNSEAYGLSLDDFGYRTETIPKAQYLTRAQACEMICEMLYLEFPRPEDYDARLKYSVHQYTLQGDCYVYAQYEDVSFKDLAVRRPKRTSSVWTMPEDIRSKPFLENNIHLGMERKSVEALIGRAYRTTGINEYYPYYYSEYVTFSDGQTDKVDKDSFLSLRYDENDLVAEIEFLG